MPASWNCRRIARNATLKVGSVDVGRAEDERLVALVAAAVEQRRGLGVGARDDDAGHLHDVELEARGAEALDLLVLGDEHLAALVAALLHARLLILDVVAGHAHLDEAPDEVAHVRVAAVAGVGVGDDERADSRPSGVALRCSSVMRARAWNWFLSAVSSARTIGAASSGTWLSG